MHWFEILQLIAIGLICIMYPIIMFISIWSLPVYVIISYFIWIISMICWICFGKKKKISEFILPICIMVIIFTFIYVSGVSEDNFEDDALFIIVTPALSTPAFCYIGCKIAEYRQERNIQQEKEWIYSLNEYYEKQLKGVNRIITLIQSAYFDGKQIEELLVLLDKCSGSELLLLYAKKSAEKNRDLILKIKGIAAEYEFSNETENQTIGEISKKMCKLKAECKDRIRSEKEININMYSEIKKEYKEKI